MNNEYTDPDLNMASEMDLILYIATQKIFSNDCAEDFLDWARNNLPQLAADLFSSYPRQQYEQAAFWMGVALWNSAPNPANHYKPATLPKPVRNNPCPCGSGKKYKQCCAQMPPLELIPTEVFWSFLVRGFSKAETLRLCKDNQFPIAAIAQMAAEYFEQQEYAQAIKMLNIVFEQRLNALNQRHTGLIDLVCDCFDAHYKTTRKKMALLEMMKNHKCNEIRAEALQRLAGIYQDDGKHKAAMDTLGAAQRANPDDPNLPLLELTLLIAENQIEQAKQRAAFWFRKWKKHENDLPDLVETLRLAQHDPLSALHLGISQSSGDERLLRLQKWTSEAERTLPDHYLCEKAHPDSPGLPEDPAAPYPADPMRDASWLVPSPKLQQLEQQWQQLTPIEKPFSVNYESMTEEDIWADPEDDEWLEFIEQNPSSINSLDILDDLITLLYMHPLNDTPFKTFAIEQQILQRAISIIKQAKITETNTLPWVMAENRPALRLLSHAINHARRENLDLDEMQLIQLYIRLNPMDNHGYRGELINLYLLSNQNQQALELAQNYPDDMIADVSYGEVLALFRSGQLKQAETRLRQAWKNLPLVAEYLLKNRVPKPDLNEYGYQLGGTDQAWFYREAMRDLWVDTTGCINWLKKNLAHWR